MEINKKVKKAAAIIGGSLEGEFDKIYPFATENISGYIKQFDLDNKSLCTVGSSCDQAFSAILNGCTDITLIDVCPFTRENFYLKLSALFALENRMQFINFFCDESTVAFNEGVFFDKISKVLMELDYPSYLFWHNLYHMYGGKTIKQGLFQKDAITIEELKYFIPYLHDDYTYNLLKAKIRQVNVKFVNGNVLDIPSYRFDNFDNVFLSNIFDYIKNNASRLEQFKIMVCFLKNQIKENGKLLVSYLYDTDNVFTTDDNMFNKCKLKSFDSVKSKYYKNKMVDSVVTYQKR